MRYDAIVIRALAKGRLVRRSTRSMACNEVVVDGTLELLGFGGRVMPSSAIALRWR